MGTDPKFDFDTAAWTGDANLSACSHAARGVWADVLCLMWKSSDRGRLVYSDGRPWSLQTIAEAVRGNTVDSLAALQELLANGVASRDTAGAIFNRKMVREEKERRAARRRQQNRRENVTPDVTAMSRHTSQRGGGKGGVCALDPNSTKTGNTEKTLIPESIDLPFDSDAFKAAWENWLAYRRESHMRAYKPRGLKAQFARLKSFGESASIACINLAIAQCWQGIPEPKAKPVASSQPKETRLEQMNRLRAERDARNA